MATTRADRRIARTMAATLLVAAAALTACAGSPAPVSAPSPSGSASPAASGSIVFTRAGGPYGDETIFMSPVDGSDERALIDAGSGCCSRVSPDGTTVLFLENARSPLMSSTIPVDGGEITRLPSPDESMSFVAQAWSPDGTRIVHEAWDDGDPSRDGVYTSGYPGGGDLVRVTVAEGGAHDIPADYSPDGTQIVFYRSAPGSEWDIGGSLWIAQADGSGVRELATPGVAPSWFARWSPDGKWIMFATGRTQGDGAIWLVHPDGSALEAIYEAPAGSFPITPTWSPDGSMILFALDPSDDEFAHPANAVYVMPAAGGEPQRLFGGDDFQRRFDWFTD